MVLISKSWWSDFCPKFAIKLVPNGCCIEPPTTWCEMGGGAAGVGCAAIQGYKQDQSKIVISGLGTNILQSVVILRNPIWLAFSENCISLVFQKDSTKWCKYYSWCAGERARSGCKHLEKGCNNSQIKATKSVPHLDNIVYMRKFPASTFRKIQA